MKKNTFIGIVGTGLIASLVAATTFAACGYIPRGGSIADLVMALGIIGYAVPALRTAIQWIRPASKLLAGWGWDAQSSAIAETFTDGYRRVRRAHRQAFGGLQQRGAIGRDLHRATAPADRRGTGRQAGGSGTATRQASGSKSADDDGGPADPPRPLLTQDALAAVLSITKKTLQNQYSATPWLLPAAIQIPGARGPRWTQESVQAWLGNRPQHTPKTAPAAPKNRKVGRPRIAYAGGGAA